MMDAAVAEYQQGNALRAAGRLSEAIACYRRALELRPDYTDAMINLGICLANSGDRDAAGETWRRALAIDPNDLQALANLANLARSQGRIGESIELSRRVLAIDPNQPIVWNNLGGAFDQRGELSEAIERYRHALTLRPRSPHLHSNLLLTMTYAQTASPQEVYDEHRRWNQMFAEPLRSTIRPHTNDRSPDRPLRVGYVSPDLKQHAVGFFLEPILEHHDRRNFAIHLYSGVVSPDRVTQRMQAFGHTWRSIVGMKDEQAADMIRADGIDILVDLSGHTSGTRLLIFARKPAPVQVAFLGYLNTTGMPAVDYRITDGWADPPGLTDPFYSEKLIRLPRCGWCFHPFEEAPDVAPAPLLQNGHVTFGSFNKLSKLSPQLIATWAELMRAVPTSRLLLKWSSLADESTRARFLALFQNHGVAPERIELAGATASMAEHLAGYGRIDLALDTFPYNGATTTCDALWMGVPLVTLAGDTHAGRIGVSLLTAIGLPELIAGSPADYVRIAAELANDPALLATLRNNMRTRVKNSPLQEPVSLTQSIESTYRQIWHEWCISF